MKKGIKILIAMLCIAVIAAICNTVVHAEDEIATTEAITSEVVAEELPIDIGEVHEIVENSSSFAEAVIGIAERFGISIEDAEELVNDMKALGDKYLGENELWAVIKNDMAQNPEKYIVIALIILVFIAIIVVLIKSIISNMGQLRVLKMRVAGLCKSVDGDGAGEGDSLRSLISAKNDEIKALEEKDAELEKEVIKLREEAARLTKEAAEVKKNTESALNVIQETALQIAQLLCIAMENGKTPILSKEARKIWLENTQVKIKAAGNIEESEKDADKVDKTIQEV